MSACSKDGYCNTRGNGVVGNQIQPLREGIRSVFTVSCVSEHVYMRLCLGNPCVAGAQLDSTLEQVAACSNHATGLVGVKLSPSKMPPRKIAKHSFLQLK